MAVPAAINPARKFRLDPDGFGLPTLLDDILGYNPELFIQLRNDFCRFFPQFRSVRVETENSLSRVFSPNGLHQSSGQIGKGVYFETQAGKAIRAQQASDGAVLFLGFLALAYLPEPPKLLLIEEPENGIYPKRLGEVIRLLKEMSQRTDRMRLPQIIISTHSPYVVSFFGPDEVTFLSRPTDQPDAPVRARPVRDAPHIRDRLAGDEFYLGELWYNLSEEELFGDA
jgi:predicted ATPase